MMSQTPLPSMFNPLPPIVFALFVILAGIEFWLTIGPFTLDELDAFVWRAEMVEHYAMHSNVTLWMIENNKYPSGHLARFVTFSFVNESILNTAIACALLLALGKIVGSVFSAIALLVFFVVSAAVGAFIFSLAVPDGGWLIGSFTGIYGLIGAYTFIMWITLRLNSYPQGSAFNLIALLMGIQLVLSVMFNDTHSWIADLTSFVTGFFLSSLFFPGGPFKVMNLLSKP